MSPPTPPIPPHGRITDPLARYVLVLLALIGTVAVLALAKDLFILLFVAGIFTFLLLPLCQAMERRGIPLWLAATLSCILLVLLFFGVLAFLGAQYAHFGRDLPRLEAALMGKVGEAQAYLEGRYAISQDRQVDWLQGKLAELAERGATMAVQLFAATGAAFATAVIIPIITFFLLLMKGRFREFFSRLRTNRDGAVLRVVENIALLSRKWIRGVLIVMVFVAVLDSIGFLVLGLEYAILLGTTAALLNVIPYLGPWLGALIPVVIALLTKDSATAALGVVAVIAVTQFMDNNFITPKVVGSSVSINPLASMVALIAWGALWGFMGLILAIPITGMIKLVFDEIPTLKPWGYLLGDDKAPAKVHLRVPRLPFRRRKAPKADPGQ
ncbi:MAG TPA: AI-2E family transporter [Flavobacteriales bacterium]|nr:AI-2E family transporter [Flavobacteriales bacterium]